VAIQGKVWNLAPEARQQLEAAGMDFVWVSGSGRRALAVGSAGLGLFGDDTALVEPWSNVASLGFPTPNKVAFVLQSSGEQFEFTFTGTADCAQFKRSIPGAELDRLLPIGGTSNSGPSAPPMARAASRVEGGSLGTIWTLLWCGVIAQFVGGIVLGLSWPAVNFDAVGQPSSEGSGIGLALGWLFIGGGSLATLVAVVGLGVRLGIRAAAEDQVGS
jgi:hypothetical protein